MMTKVNCKRSGCKDVFHAFLVENAVVKGEFQFPIIRSETEVPRKMITFSESFYEKKDFNKWICFYEDDCKFERLWNNPQKYLNHLRRFTGVVCPDFSLYYDFPLAQQIWNIYRSRAIGSWLQNQGVKVIPNIRFGDCRTFDCSCDGIPMHGIICVGSLGCLNISNYKPIFEDGLLHIVKKLQPDTLLIYGPKPDNYNEIKKICPNIVIYAPDYYHHREGDK